MDPLRAKITELADKWAAMSTHSTLIGRKTVRNWCAEELRAALAETAEQPESAPAGFRDQAGNLNAEQPAPPVVDAAQEEDRPCTICARPRSTCRAEHERAKS